MAESSLAPLPDDIDALKALISARDVALAEQHKKLSERDKKIAVLEEYVRLLKSQRFGKSSERFVSDRQESLFNEAEQLADEEPETETSVEDGEVAEVDSASTASGNNNSTEHKARPGRRKLPAHLPRVKVIHELPEGQRQCPCGCQLEVFDEAISEQLCIIPADLYVIQHCRQKYRCITCDDQAPVTAPMPAQPFPKSNASPELMANVAVSKFLD